MLPRMLPAAATSPFDRPRFEASDSSPYDMQSGPIVHVAVLVDLGLPTIFLGGRTGGRAPSVRSGSELVRADCGLGGDNRRGARA